ncbi:putative 1-deoxy-D-xylulose-5-phosphate synthase, chloroplastic isoform X2 [Nicotiana tabacum]|uniref:1-deoxy-D-xylulose-5-phosphate synthase, chloroplastic isoform X2 n=1 Tax=Nicotiana tabacum TaxID=4097 RepID=A0AC58U0U2_TOBAC|nr:probable 1-deoxy-D-xylulose-5-phosphate synthase, chloroplastic isoform X2 [Nicotiana tomentosiformis]
MVAVTAQYPFGICPHFHGNSRLISPETEFYSVNFPPRIGYSRLSLHSKDHVAEVYSLPFDSDFSGENETTAILDAIESPMNLKNLSTQELKQLANEVRSELSFIIAKAQKPSRSSLAVVELTVAIHHVFHAPVDKILWDVAEQGLTKKFGKGMHEWAAKIDEYARGMIGPPGSTLFEELGLYYIGPVDGHNIEDLVCVLNEVASLDSMGPVLVHVITKEELKVGDNQMNAGENKIMEGASSSDTIRCGTRTYSDCFVEALISEAERHKDIVAVHAGMGMEPSLHLLKNVFAEKFFDVGMAEQHAVTFSAGLACGGLKPFCIIPSAFLQRAYDQVIHDVDRQKVPVRFIITSAGLVGSDGPTQCGAFDIAFMSCLPNMIVMAPSDEVELSHMVATAALIDDRPVCFRYPRGALSVMDHSSGSGIPIEVGKGRILTEGKDIALLGYGSMVQNCLRAQSLLSKLGVEVTVADARFCKPLDIKLLRHLCKNHSFLVTVEEGSIGGFASHVAQFISLDGQLDAGIKWRPITLPDNYIEQASPTEQLAVAGLSGNHIAATALSLLGRNREALLLMC